jgi:hypothetical protein
MKECIKVESKPSPKRKIPQSVLYRVRKFIIIPRYLWSHFPQFQLPILNCSPKVLHGKVQK